MLPLAELRRIVLSAEFFAACLAAPWHNATVDFSGPECRGRAVKNGHDVLVRLATGRCARLSLTCPAGDQWC